MSNRDELTGLLNEINDQEVDDQEPKDEGGSEPLFRRKPESSSGEPKKTRPWSRKAALAAVLVLVVLVVVGFSRGRSTEPERAPVAERTFKNYLLSVNRQHEEQTWEGAQFQDWQLKPEAQAKGKAQGFVARVFESVRGWFN